MLLLGCLLVAPAWAVEAQKLVSAAREQVGVTLSYDPQYRRLAYPGGDVPLETGVCTDVVIRALRQQGLDLQKAVHEDMTANFARYPRHWGLTRPDRNIDHRRVPNLMTWFARQGLAVQSSAEGGRLPPGRHRHLGSGTRPDPYRYRFRSARRRRRATDPAQHRLRHAGRGHPAALPDHRPLPFRTLARMAERNSFHAVCDRIRLCLISHSGELGCIEKQQTTGRVGVSTSARCDGGHSTGCVTAIDRRGGSAPTGPDQAAKRLTGINERWPLVER